jgi:hypothetical protein
MLFVLKQDIAACWERLKESGFEDESLLKELNKSIIDYKDYIESLER